MNHYDGEHHEFLGQNSKGYLISVIFNPMGGPLVIFPQNSRLSQAKWCIVFNSKRSEAKTPSEIELIARRKSNKRK